METLAPSALATDLYQLTMLAGYDRVRSHGRATFELYVRALPRNRAFLVAAGLAQALDYLEALHFSAEEVAWLRTLPNLRGAPASFFDDTLANLRFTGEVWAVPEGTPVFAWEPLLRVTAPVIEAQLVETALLAILTFQTSIASKSARIVAAADGRSVMEFGSRRAHGTQAAMYAARAAYVAGCDSTSNVEAGYRFGIPLAGTMAHSWVTAFGDEIEAFREYAAVFGARAVFLIDTYDTVEAARRIVASGLAPRAVRIDSGDLVALSKDVRRVLDAGGLQATGIIVSGDLDEWSISRVLAQGAPIDSFGVGTALSTSSDAPALGGVYKLVEVEMDGHHTPVMKLSGSGKSTYPGRKQVWRRMRGEHAVEDVISLASEHPPQGAVPLLERVMAGGQRLDAAPSLDAIRAWHRARVVELPAEIRRLDPPESYPVSRSGPLEALTERTAATLAPTGD
jgi:nicotinate phosphoribosyltransferase